MLLLKVLVKKSYSSKFNSINSASDKMKYFY